MSLKPLCDSPKDLESFAFKTMKGGFFKAVKKLAKKHDNPGAAAPFYLCTEQKYADADKEFFMVFGKLSKWKKYAKDNAMNCPALRGACYVSLDPEKKCLVLNLMPVAGKLKTKEDLIGKALKTIVSPSRCRVALVKGEFTEEQLEQLEKATEEMEEVQEDVSGDAMEDQVTQMHELVDKAQDSGQLTQEQSQQLEAMRADIETLENLLEEMAASDDLEAIKSLDKQIRTVFAKYVKAK